MSLNVDTEFNKLSHFLCISASCGDKQSFGFVASLFMNIFLSKKFIKST